MSDKNFDQLLAALGEEEKPEAPAKRAPRAARANMETEEAASLQRRKRADDAYTQVNASIRKELKPSLFYMKHVETSLSEVIEEFLEDYVAKRGSIIGAKAPRKKN
jgi:predicted CopG family antitoxin